MGVVNYFIEHLGLYLLAVFVIPFGTVLLTFLIRDGIIPTIKIDKEEISIKNGACWGYFYIRTVGKISDNYLFGEKHYLAAEERFCLTHLPIEVQARTIVGIRIKLLYFLWERKLNGLHGSKKSIVQTDGIYFYLNKIVGRSMVLKNDEIQKEVDRFYRWIQKHDQGKANKEYLTSYVMSFNNVLQSVNKDNIKERTDLLSQINQSLQETENYVKESRLLEKEKSDQEKDMQMLENINTTVIL